MTTAESRALRLLQLLMLLDAHRAEGIHVADLAERLGVTCRQAYRDLAGIEAIRVPVVSPRPGYYTLLDGYRLPRVLQ